MTGVEGRNAREETTTPLFPINFASLWLCLNFVELQNRSNEQLE